jgi:hypothetical protein
MNNEWGRWARLSSLTTRLSGVRWCDTTVVIGYHKITTFLYPTLVGIMHEAISIYVYCWFLRFRRRVTEDTHWYCFWWPDAGPHRLYQGCQHSTCSASWYHPPHLPTAWWYTEWLMTRWTWPTAPKRRSAALATSSAGQIVPPRIGLCSVKT